LTGTIVLKEILGGFPLALGSNGFEHLTFLLRKNNNLKLIEGVEKWIMQ